jgi:GR25 family glycosyltransferase involved in LPS biosynthesis
MLLTDKYKFIFLKSYKTAGTSVEIFFEQYCDSFLKETHFSKEIITKDYIIGFRRESIQPIQLPTFYDHIPAYILKENIGKKFDDYFKFSVIRNPFDMVVSSYFWSYNFYSNRKKDYFEEYIETMIDIFAKRTKDILYIDNQIILNDFIRFENLINDLERIRKKINLPEPIRKLQKYKSSNRPKNFDYRLCYNKKTRKLVEKHFEYYLNDFNYSF